MKWSSVSSTAGSITETAFFFEGCVRQLVIITEFQTQSANDAPVSSISFSKPRDNHMQPKNQARMVGHGPKPHFL
jgi:hypothetical protein